MCSGWNFAFNFQHDIPEKMLRKALEGVLVDCVSLVGVDINAANVHTLK